MDIVSSTQRAMIQDAVLLISRLLLALIFLHEGAFLVANVGPTSASMAKLGVPPFLFVATIALQLVAGSAIAAGWHARWGALALGLFCLATAILFHTNFSNRNELLHFEKDLAIAGGMFVLMVHGAGGWSIDGMRQRKTLVWRFRSPHHLCGESGMRTSEPKPH
jgi:putative oxidoreductase